MTAVADITVPSEEDVSLNHQLQLVTSSEVPKLLRAEVYVSGPPPGVPRFWKLLKGHNAGLHTDRWLLPHQQSTSYGMLMVRNTDQESAADG